MRDFVLKLLETGLSANYYYHCIEHTLYVVEKVREIGMHEGCSNDEFRLLEAAALWHDTGFVVGYENHEEEGIKLARKNLPNFGYTVDEIDLICTIILATKIPQSPKDKLGQILADADLEYLGTDKAEEISNNLFKELNVRNPELTIESWDKIQISFIQKHTYFTNYCLKNKAPKQAEYLNKLLNKI